MHSQYSQTEHNRTSCQDFGDFAMLQQSQCHPPTPVSFPGISSVHNSAMTASRLHLCGSNNKPAVMNNRNSRNCYCHAPVFGDPFTYHRLYAWTLSLFIQYSTSSHFLLLLLSPLQKQLQVFIITCGLFFFNRADSAEGEGIKLH